MIVSTTSPARLGQDRHHPEKFHIEKSEIRAALARLAKETDR